MSALDDAKSQIETQLRSSLGAMVPSAADQQWIADLAADLAEQKVLYDAATTDDDRSRIVETLVFLNVRWKLRLAQKEQYAENEAQSLVLGALSTAVTCFFPALGPMAGIAKLVATNVISKLGSAGAS